MDNPVDLEIRDGIAVLTLNRPGKRNALSTDLMLELGASARTIADRPETRVLVVTGAGDAFCAGGDLGDIEDLHDVPRLVRRHDLFMSAVLSLGRLPVPMIAAVNGAAVGAGLALALHCDIVIVQRGAPLRFGFLDVGLPPDLFSALSLQARVGATVASDLLLLDAPLDADDARRLRLINDVAPDALTAAMEHARRLAQLSPYALEHTVKLLRAAKPAPDTTTASEALAVATAVGTEEFRSATSQFRHPETATRPRDTESGS